MFMHERAMLSSDLESTRRFPSYGPRARCGGSNYDRFMAMYGFAPYAVDKKASDLFAHTSLLVLLFFSFGFLLINPSFGQSTVLFGVGFRRYVKNATTSTDELLGT